MMFGAAVWRLFRNSCLSLPKVVSVSTISVMEESQRVSVWQDMVDSGLAEVGVISWSVRLGPHLSALSSTRAFSPAGWGMSGLASSPASSSTVSVRKVEFLLAFGDATGGWRA